MRLRATRLTAVASAARAAIAQVANPFAGAAAMYGMRIPVGSTYSGPLLRVRRSSDNAELDIGAGSADSNGNRPLDVDALLTFCGVPSRPLNAVTGASAAFSLRKLSSSYSGSAIRVRRSSDNAEQDIGFTAAGDLDTVALLAFTGANNGFVTTWYDQSGNGRNATQTTAANQPRIVNAGVVDVSSGKPSILFDSASFNCFAIQGSSFAAGAKSVFSVVRVDGSGISSFGQFKNEDGSFFEAIANLGVSYRQISFSNYIGTMSSVGYGTVGGATSIAPTVLHYGYNGGTVTATTSYQATSNGAVQTLATSSAFLAVSTNLNAIGARITSTSTGTVQFPLNGAYSELVIYPSILSTAARQTVEQSQSVYYGITYATTIPSGFVTTWYDQSGNARNATQATSAAQPRIVNAGVLETLNSKPTVNFLGSGQRLALSVSLPGAFSISHVAKANSITSYARTLSGLSDSQIYVGQISGNYGVGTGTGSGWVSLGANSPAISVVDAARVLSIINDKTTTGLVPRVDGVAQAAKNGTGAAISGLYIGGDVQLWQGQISEVAVWATALTPPVCQDIERSQGGYYGITVA